MRLGSSAEAQFKCVDTVEHNGGLKITFSCTSINSDELYYAMGSSAINSLDISNFICVQTLLSTKTRERT